jgi:hypothetical protein
MTNKEIKRECEKHIGKTFPIADGLFYQHGRAKEMTITSVVCINGIVSVLNSMTFEDGYKSPANSYACDGNQFLSWIN